MDCNKEEATRAINLAEEKMRRGDFVGAHKLIMKAQRLFPELENIQKLLAVCDVHSSADKKIKGLDDWYGILQVQPSADSDTIKKQYRKLCLLLHPDKNKFPGAEAAFKLVGEANRLLSDQSKRSQYDVRYRSHSLFASKESNANANSLRNSSSANAAAVNIASGLTFWTCCRSCGHRYKYLKVYMNQLMHCSSCKKSYTACNIGSDGVSFSGSTAGVKQFQDQGIPRQHPSTGAESGSSAAEMDQNGTVGGKLNRRNRNKQKRGSSNKKPKKDEGCTESEAEGGRPQKGETVANNSVEVAKPDVLKPQPEVKEPETSAAAEMNKNGTVGGKLNKRSHKKQKREAGNKKPKKDEGCTESEAEGGRSQKGETVTNNSAEVPKPDVLKPQPEVKEPETSAAAEVNKNGTVGKKLNKRSQKKQKREAGDKKPKKDEGCTESEAEGGRPHKGETVTNNSVEVPKPDVLKPQPEVKEPETSAAAEMNKNGTVRGKLNKRNQKNQKRVAGDKKPEKDEVCTENDAEAGRPQIGAEIPKPDILKSQPEVKEPQTSAGKPMPDLSAQKTNQTARKKRKAVEESSMSFEVDGADAAVDKTDTDESYKRKPQVSYAEKRGNSDSVIPPTKMTKSGCEVESDVNTKQTAEDNTSLEPAEKGKAKESENSGNNNIFSGKNKESEGCDRNGEDAALSSKMSEVENGHNKADENRNTLEIPDPEFNVFEDEREPENFAVNQVWSTCDSRDGMPRRYARVRKVLSSDFKLRVTYLKPVQENNDESIPVTWGKFNNGETKDVENRSIFSGQMLHSVCNRVVSIYPRKGEIWAMFSDWDEESSTLENHELPYKYDFVEIVNDFKEEAGIGAAYLGKVKGFVSLFQREAKNTVCQVQFAPERMLRFSHKVPAVKMTGIEKEGVPAGSYELDPTALPKDIFQAEAVNVEMDSETMKGKADSPDPEALETEVNAKPVPEIVPSPPRKRQKSDDDGGCSNRDKVCSTSVSIGKGEATKANDSSSSQVSKKSTPNGSRKSGEASDAFKLRKSPRLQTTPSQQIEEKKSAKQGDKINPPKTTDKVLVTDSLGINKSSKGIQQQVERQVGEGSKKRGRDGELPSSSKQNDLPAQLDGSTNRSLETTPASSSCKTPQRNAFDFNNERSVDKFRRDQIWAIYSDDKGMPTEYVKVKKVETKPEVVLHVAHMELWPPSTEPVTRSVSCGEFKMETGKPKTLPLTSFSHRVKPFDSKQKIVKVYPRKGDIWALRKSCDSTEAEHDIVEVVEGYCEGKSIKAMALTAKGFSSIYTRKHGSHVSSLVVPKAEMSRFSHQIPAVKQEKRATRVAEGGYWELDPAAIPPPTTIVID